MEEMTMLELIAWQKHGTKEQRRASIAEQARRHEARRRNLAAMGDYCESCDDDRYEEYDSASY